MATIKDLSFNDTPQSSDSVPIYGTSSGTTQRTSINKLVQGGLSNLPTVQPVNGSGELWIDPLDGNAIKVAGPANASASSNLTQAVADLINGTADDASTLTGAENVPMNRSAGLLQTSLTKIAQWVIQTYQGFTQSGTGAVARTVQDKARDAVSVKDFGAKGDGTTDDTSAIQAALNSGAMCVYVPSGRYKVGSLTMPLMVGFVLRGDGTNSVLVQTNSGPVLKYPVNASNNFYSQGFIRNLAFDGTNGASHTVDTSYCGGLTLQGLYFNNVPTGYSSLYVSGSTSVYTHDIRINGLQIYSSNAGASGVTFGPTAADCTLTDFIMNGNFVVSNAISFGVGASSIRVSNAHPYNTASNIALLQGTNPGIEFIDTVFDNCTADNVSSTGNSGTIFTNCRFQAIKSGKNGLALMNCVNTLVQACKWDGSSGATSCVSDQGTTGGTTVLGGVVDAPGNFATPFSLSSSSAVRFVNNNNPLGLTYQMVGATTAAVAQNTTTYLGVNGATSSSTNTAFICPYNSAVLLANVYCDTTPAAGQTFTLNVQKNGVTVGTGAISNGSFSCSIPLTSTTSVGDRIAIQLVTSATSGSANFRYFVTFSA